MLKQLFYCALFAPSFLIAQNTSPIAAKGLVKVALEYGGEEISRVYFTDGTSVPIRAGQGGAILGGIQLQSPKVKAIALQLGVGIKYVTTPGDNGHVRLTRIPVQALAQVAASEKVHLRGGFLRHQNIKLKGDGFVDNITFNPANGFMAEVVYKGFGIAYTKMEYTDNRNDASDASNIGVSYVFTF
jgi:hypothetical protein